MAELAIIEKWAENLDEVTVSRWLVAEGDTVASGDALCEIITDKATFEYEVDRGGIVQRIYCPPRSTVPVGYVIAFIGAPDEAPPPDIEARNRALMDEHRQRAKAELSLDLKLPARGREPATAIGIVRATPAAKRLARERGVSLDDITRGSTGVITEAEVRAFLGEEPPA